MLEMALVWVAKLHFTTPLSCLKLMSFVKRWILHDDDDVDGGNWNTSHQGKPPNKPQSLE